MTSKQQSVTPNFLNEKLSNSAALQAEFGASKSASADELKLMAADRISTDIESKKACFIVLSNQLSSLINCGSIEYNGGIQ